MDALECSSAWYSTNHGFCTAKNEVIYVNTIQHIQVSFLNTFSIKKPVYLPSSLTVGASFIAQWLVSQHDTI